MIYKTKMLATDTEKTHILYVTIKTLEIKNAAKRLSGVMDEVDTPHMFSNLFDSLCAISNTTQQNNKEVAPVVKNISKNIKTILDSMGEVPSDIKNLMFQGIRFGDMLESESLSPTPDQMEQMLDRPMPNYREGFYAEYNALPQKSQIEEFNLARQEFMTSADTSQSQLL